MFSSIIFWVSEIASKQTYFLVLFSLRSYVQQVLNKRINLNPRSLYPISKISVMFFLMLAGQLCKLYLFLRMKFKYLKTPSGTTQQFDCNV